MVFRVRLALVLMLLAGCAKEDREREARELATLDLAEASARLRGWIDSCAGFSRALDRLSRISGRSLAGLVDDAVNVATSKCAQPIDAAHGPTAAHRLARARLLDDRPSDALATLDAGGTESALGFRRAELLDRIGRTSDALRELDAAIARASDDEALQLRRLFQVSIEARAGRSAAVAAAIAEAPLIHRPALAFRATADVSPAELAALGSAATEPELANAVGDRLERERGELAALPARARAAALAPERAEHHDALARSLVTASQLDAAVRAWDRAATIAPAQAAYKLAPIRALVGAGAAAAATARVNAIAAAAQQAADVDLLLVASTAAAVTGDHARAIELAREATRLRPTDGRLVFTLGERLAAGGDHAAAADTFAQLLVCGAHGRPWHRHEVAGHLVALASDGASARTVALVLDARRSCVPADPADLADYIAAMRVKLAELSPTPRGSGPPAR